MSGSAGPSLGGAVFSEVEWVDRACRSALDRVVEPVAEALRPLGLVGLFLAGSAARGEAVGCELPDGTRQVLSDLDLGAVVRRPATAAIGQRLREIARVVESEAQTAGPEITVGVSLAHLQAQQDPTPGFVDLVATAVPLLGHPAVVSRFVVPRPGAIPHWEGLRLLGNRSRELLGAPDPSRGDAEWVRWHHAAAKLVFACWTAWLIRDDRYRIGTRERLRLLEGFRGAAAPPESCRTSWLRWGEFLVAPSREFVPPGPPAPEVRTGLRETLARWGARAFDPQDPQSDPESDPESDARSDREPDAAFDPEDVCSAYLAEPVRVRARLREWTRRSRRDPAGWGRLALASAFQGTPVGRLLGACTLYCSTTATDSATGEWLRDTGAEERRRDSATGEFLRDTGAEERRRDSATAEFLRGTGAEERRRDSATAEWLRGTAGLVPDRLRTGERIGARLLQELGGDEDHESDEPADAS